jgi:site-specific recombinase XerD
MADRIKVGDRVTLYRSPASPFWYLQFNMNGKQFRTSLGTRSKKRAMGMAMKKDAQLVLGQAEPPTVKPISIGSAQERYLRTVAARGRSPKTVEAYRSKLNVFNAFCGQHGIRYLQAVTASLLEDYQQQLQEKGMTTPVNQSARGRKFKASANRPRTVRDKLKLVRQLIKWAQKRGLLKTDPAVGYDLPPMVKQQAHCWSPEELSAILDHASSDMLDVFHFLRLTGLRADEFCWLTKDDVIANPPHLKIRAKVCPLTETAWKPKHACERIVPLCPQAFEIAQRAIATSAGPWAFFAPGTQGKSKGRWRVGRIWKILKSTMKAAGVARGTTHTFRHVFCSFLANQGVSPFRIMKVMGHGSLDIVLLYCHATEAELIEAIVSVPFERMVPEQKKGGSNPAKN